MITTRNEFLSQPNFYLDQSLRHIQSNQPIRSWTNFLYPGAKREKKHVGEPVRILVFILLLIGARFLSQNQGIAGLQVTSWRPCRTKALGVRWELMKIRREKMCCFVNQPPCHVVANQEHSPYLHLNDYVTIGLLTKWCICIGYS